MAGRILRLAILALLLVTGLGAAYLTWNLSRRMVSVLEAEREIDVRLDRLLATVAALGAAQQAYVAPGQAHGEWLGRVSSLLQQIYDQTTAIRAQARSSTRTPALRAFDQSLDAFVRADTRAREHLQTDQELMAADLVFSEGREAIATMAARLHDLQAAERATADAESRGALTQAARVLGAAAGIWLLGVLFLLAIGGRRSPTAVQETSRMIRRDDSPRESERVEEHSASEPPAVDLMAAANVCTALSRVTSAAALPALLERVARLIDASGIIVWLGAGEELFAATAFGYDAKVIARLGPIGRQAENATAAAWRAAEMRTVPGDAMANGAIVAPLFWPGGCIGVLAAEVRHGRERDEATRAVTTLIAAQLAAIVAAWPAPSAVEGPAPSTVEGPAPSAVEGPAPSALEGTAEGGAEQPVPGIVDEPEPIAAERPAPSTNAEPSTSDDEHPASAANG